MATKTQVKLPIVSAGADLDGDLEAEMAAFEADERKRLGLAEDRKQWVDEMTAPKVAKREKDSVTILISGLTAAQDFLVTGALSGLGYKVTNIAAPDQRGLTAGKEFGNRGQCNPTYYTVGNLVRYLLDRQEEAQCSAQEIVDKYVFLTAGACGPCRFGMYVTEYRKSLRDAGFDGFRVMLFQQQGGLSQATGDDLGIEFTPPFFIGIVKALLAGDALNALGYRIRPYEVVAGETDRVTEESKRILWKALNEKTSIFVALWSCRKLFESIAVDPLRAKAKVAIIGEFWAMTTEGEGNYRLKSFIEQEGGENDIQLVIATLLYNVWEVSRDTRERRFLQGADGGQYGLETLDELGVAKRLATMRAADAALRLGFKAFALPLGLRDYHLPDMEHIADVAKDYYTHDLRGGEGHLEVGKLIVNALGGKAHMTLSVKPFGCMPSSGVSDGVQSLVATRFPQSIFCAVETSGDGATNFYSRVQMFLYKAKLAAEAELRRTYVECGVTEAEVRAFLDAHPAYKSPLHHAPHRVAGSAANLVYEVAPLITASRLERATARARASVGAAVATLRETPAAARAVVAFARSPETHARLREDWLLLSDLAKGKFLDRARPLLQKVAGKALFGDDATTTVTVPARASHTHDAHGEAHAAE